MVSMKMSRFASAGSSGDTEVSRKRLAEGHGVRRPSLWRDFAAPGGIFEYGYHAPGWDQPRRWTSWATRHSIGLMRSGGWTFTDFGVRGGAATRDGWASGRAKLTGALLSRTCRKIWGSDC